MEFKAHVARVGVTAALMIAVSCTQTPGVNTDPVPGNSAQVIVPAADSVAICVIERDTLRMIRAAIVWETKDTVVAGMPFAERYPATSPPYATGATWFAQNHPIRFQNRWYYGGNHPPQIISIELLARIGHHYGVPIFSEVGDSVPEIIYVPLRPGCVFQSYIGIHSRPDIPSLE